jgi:hypothetical protein
MRAATAYKAGNVPGYKSLMKYCLILAAFNWVTDFGAASVLRDATNVFSQNTNRTATQRLGEVKRIEDRLVYLRTELAKMKDIKTEGHYTAQLGILKATLGNDGRNIWQRSKGCDDVTIPESQEHCRLIGAAQKGASAAQLKRRYQDERLTLTQQLPAAKQASQEVKQESNPVVAQIGNFASLVLLSFEHSNGQIKWGILIFTLCWTMIFSLIIFRESWGSAIAAPIDHDSPWARNEWLPDQRPQAARETAAGQEAMALRTTNNTTVFNDANLDVIKRAAAKARAMAA